MKNIILNSLLIDQETSIKNALFKINKSGLGICFLTEKNKLTNVIKDGDIRRALLNGLKLNNKIKLVKKKNFVFAKQNYKFIEIQKKISKYKVVPIVNSKGEVIDYADDKRFRQIPLYEPILSGRELEYLTEAIRSGWISSKGKFVSLFEKKFSNFVKNKFCLSTSSGTTALQLAIASLKLKNGDEIIVPDYTFAAPINTIIHAGCKPVLADIDPDSLCVSFDSVKKLISKKTKAIIIVHLYGNIGELTKIINLCKKKKIFIIEDCAEGLGSKFKNKHVGNFGDVGTFSFFGNKTISTGEGGMAIFKSKKNFDLAKKLRDHGMSEKKKYWHDEIGFNFRFTNLQAAVGCAQLEKVNVFIKKKLEIQKRYKSKLKNLRYINFPKIRKNIINSHWLCYFKINNDISSKEKVRDNLVRYLNNNGIEARNGFYSSHLMKIYKNFKSKKINYYNSNNISSTIVTLPSSASLKNKEIDYICKIINNFKFF